MSREIVQSYLDRGLQIVVWPSVDAAGKSNDWKGPRDAGWLDRAIAGGYTIDDYAEGDRVGLVHGIPIKHVTPERYVVDVDIGYAPGIEIAKAMLPATQFIYGRPSKRVSHCLYTCPDVVSMFAYKDIGKDGRTLIEFRSDVHQAMAPPGFWEKDGKREQLTFVIDKELTFVDSAGKLKQRVCLSAIGMILGIHFGKNGFGHDARLAWAGFLLRAGIDVNDLVTMGVALSKHCNNTEVGDVRQVIANLKDPAKKVKGGPALATLLGTNGPAVVARINEWLGRAESDTITIVGGKLTEIVDRAEAALLTGSTIYQRGGQLTRAIKLDAARSDTKDVRREAGSTMLIAVHDSWLIEQMARVLKWVRHKEASARSDAKDSPADPPGLYARTLLGRGEWTFPVLRGVVTAPTLARDGRIIETPGFDAASGLLLDFPAGSFPPVPPSPSKEEARRMLARLSLPVRAFPFVSDADKSVALSALLTALVRVSMRTAPMHGYDASTAGTGKSLLAEMVGLLAMGSRPPALSQGKTVEEDEKRLATVLFAGDPVIHIDNCEQPISGDFLSSLLTQEIVQARILGLSERRVLPSTALVLASGNNLTFAGDTSRRAVVCRIDAKVERPDTREFDFDCHAEVLASRPELVVAGLTILRAYHCAGRPAKLTPMGSFTDWEWIRGALVWLDCADPADTRSSILDNDPEKEELIVVMDLWLAACGTGLTAVADIHARAEAPAKEHEPLPMADIALRNKLIEVAGKGGKWSAKSVGWWLRRHKDRVVGKRSFRMGQHKGQRGQEWRLEASDAAPVQPQLEPEPENDASPF